MSTTMVEGAESPSRAGRPGKVRIASSILAGFEFLFTRFGRILKVAWLPGVILVFAAILKRLVAPVADINAMSDADAFNYFLNYVGVMFAGSLVELAMTLIVVVGLYRIALYDYKPRGFAYLEIGMDEFRVAGIWLLVVSLLYITFMALVYMSIGFVAAFVGLIGPSSDGGLADSAGLVAGLSNLLRERSGGVFAGYFIIASLVFLWVYGRLYLAMPSALDQKTSSIGAVWDLTAKSHLRMMVYLSILFVFLVAFAFTIVLLIWFASFVASQILVLVLSREAQAALVLLMSNPGAVMKDWAIHWQVAAIATFELSVFLISMLGWSIIVGSAAHAYRNLTEE